MKKIFKRTSLLLATALIGGTATVQAQKSPQDMDRFIDVWGIERSGFFNGREKWAKGFENQRV